CPGSPVGATGLVIMRLATQDDDGGLQVAVHRGLGALSSPSSMASAGQLSGPGVDGFGRPGEVGCLPGEGGQGGGGDRTCGTVSDQAGLVVRIAAAGARIACAVP